MKHFPHLGTVEGDAAQNGEVEGWIIASDARTIVVDTEANADSWVRLGRAILRENSLSPPTAVSSASSDTPVNNVIG